jgi:hypothetical protein
MVAPDEEAGSASNCAWLVKTKIGWASVVKATAERIARPAKDRHGETCAAN